MEFQHSTAKQCIYFIGGLKEHTILLIFASTQRKVKQDGITIIPYIVTLMVNKYTTHVSCLELKNKCDGDIRLCIVARISLEFSTQEKTLQEHWKGGQSDTSF